MSAISEDARVQERQAEREWRNSAEGRAAMLQVSSEPSETGPGQWHPEKAVFQATIIRLDGQNREMAKAQVGIR